MQFWIQCPLDPSLLFSTLTLYFAKGHTEIERNRYLSLIGEGYLHKHIISMEYDWKKKDQMVFEGNDFKTSEL